jgi:hypothetical protein
LVLCEANPAPLPVQLRGVPPFELLYGDFESQQLEVATNLSDSLVFVPLDKFARGTASFDLSLRQVSDRFCLANLLDSARLRVHLIPQTVCTFETAVCEGSDFFVNCVSGKDEGILVVRYRQEIRLPGSSIPSFEEHTIRVSANVPFHIPTRAVLRHSQQAENMSHTASGWPDGAVMQVVLTQVEDESGCEAIFPNGRSVFVYSRPKVELSVFGDACGSGSAELFFGLSGVPPFHLSLREVEAVRDVTYSENTTLLVTAPGHYVVTSLNDATHCSADGQGTVASAFVPGNPMVRVVSPDVSLGERLYIGGDVVVELVQGTPPWSLLYYEVDLDGKNISRLESGLRTSSHTIKSVVRPIHLAKVTEDNRVRCSSDLSESIWPKTQPKAALSAHSTRLPGDQLNCAVSDVWLTRSDHYSTESVELLVFLSGGEPPYSFSLWFEGAEVQKFTTREPEVRMPVKEAGVYELHDLADSENTQGSVCGSVVAKFMDLDLPERCVCPVIDGEDPVVISARPIGPPRAEWLLSYSVCELGGAETRHEISCISDELCRVAPVNLAPNFTSGAIRSFSGAVVKFVDAATTRDAGADDTSEFPSHVTFSDARQVLIAQRPNVELSPVWLFSPPRVPIDDTPTPRQPRWSFVAPFEQFEYFCESERKWDQVLRLEMLFSPADPSMLAGGKENHVVLSKKFAARFTQLMAENVGTTFGSPNVVLPSRATRFPAGGSNVRFQFDLQLSECENCPSACSLVDALVPFADRFNADNAGSTTLAILGMMFCPDAAPFNRTDAEECLFEPPARSNDGDEETPEVTVLRRDLSRICLRRRNVLSPSVDPRPSGAVVAGGAHEFMAIELDQLNRGPTSMASSVTIVTEQLDINSNVVPNSGRTHKISFENGTAYLPIESFFVDRRTADDRSTHEWRISLANFSDECSCTWDGSSELTLRTGLDPECRVVSTTFCAGSPLDFSCVGETPIVVNYSTIDSDGIETFHVARLDSAVDSVAAFSVPTASNTTRVFISSVTDASECSSESGGWVFEVSRPTASLRRVPDSCVDMSNEAARGARGTKSPNPAVELEVVLSGSPPWTITYTNTQSTQAAENRNHVVISNITESPYIFKEPLFARVGPLGAKGKGGTEENSPEELVAHTHITLQALSDARCDSGVILEDSSVTASVPTLVLLGGGDVCEGSLANFTVTLQGDDTPIDRQVDWTYGWTNIHTQSGEEQYTRTRVAVDQLRLTDSFQMGFDGQYRLIGGSDRNGCVANVRNAALPVVVRPLPTARLSGGGVLCQDEVVEEGDEPAVPTHAHFLQLSLTGSPPWRVEYIDARRSSPGDAEVEIFVEDDIRDANAKIPAPTGRGGEFQLIAIQDRYCRYADPAWAHRLSQPT